jgi:hypothetical protein
MMRVSAMTIVASLAAGILPASAYSCAEWCSTYHCRRTELGPQRVCMNRCIAACRLIVSKRRSTFGIATASDSQ